MLQFSATFTDLIIIGKHEMRTASGLHTQVSTFSRHIVNLKKITQTYGTLLHSNTKFAATGFCVVFHVFVLTVRLPITWGTDQTCRVEHTFRYIHAIVWFLFHSDDCGWDCLCLAYVVRSPPPSE